MEYGASTGIDLKLMLGQNLLFTSDLDAFSNLKTSNQIQAKWNNVVTAKVDTWMSTNVAADRIYDKSRVCAGQFMESLSRTFSYHLL